MKKYVKINNLHFQKLLLIFPSIPLDLLKKWIKLPYDLNYNTSRAGFCLQD